MEALAALDDETFAVRFAGWLTAQRGDAVVVDQIERPAVGYSSVTTMCRATWQRDARSPEHLVVRMAPQPAGTFPDYDLSAQHAAQLAAAAVGVPIATPLVTETDRSWLGAPFTVMPRVVGHIIGEAPAFDRWLRELGAVGQARLYDHFLSTLATIHGAPLDAATSAGVPVRDDAAELDYWGDYLRWSADGAPLPQLVDALDWCRAHAPARSTVDRVLRWGDVRFGNVVFGDDLRPRAVLDWDMTAIGAPEHDVAWLTMLDWMMTRLSGKRVEGFLDRSATVARYEALTGRKLEAFEWYETFALVRSTAIMTRIGYLTSAAGHAPALPIDDNPLLELLRERTRS